MVVFLLQKTFFTVLWAKWYSVEMKVSVGKGVLARHHTDFGVINTSIPVVVLEDVALLVVSCHDDLGGFGELSFRGPPNCNCTSQGLQIIKVLSLHVSDNELVFGLCTDDDIDVVSRREN